MRKLGIITVTTALLVLSGRSLALRAQAAKETAEDGATGTAADKSTVSKSGLFDGNIGYVRVARVDDGLARAVRQAYEKVGGTNKLKGLVLDLRYSGGDDYAAAAAVADLFLKKERALLNWGNGLVRSREKSDAITAPLAVLVNHETAGAPEALAAVLREAGLALILGNQTAGRAASIELGSGVALSAEGLKPDISVAVSPDDERAFYADPFKGIPKAETRAEPQAIAKPPPGFTNRPEGTNRTRRSRINEAELVRERREGLLLDAEPTTGTDNEPEKPVVRDPALARGLDFLKGLDVVRHSRS